MSSFVFLLFFFLAKNGLSEKKKFLAPWVVSRAAISACFNPCLDETRFQEYAFKWVNFTLFLARLTHSEVGKKLPNKKTLRVFVPWGVPTNTRAWKSWRSVYRRSSSTTDASERASDEVATCCCSKREKEKRKWEVRLIVAAIIRRFFFLVFLDIEICRCVRLRRCGTSRRHLRVSPPGAIHMHPTLHLYNIP